MKRELYNRWLAELRDPNNRQIDGVLKDLVGARCCLGVLADLCKVSHKPALGACYQYDFGGDWKEGMPTEAWWRRTTGAPWLIAQGLADMNDNDRTFPEIADLLEEMAGDGRLPLED